MSYDFHPEALDEFESAADFYAECQPGLELRFIDAVQAAIARACEAPDRWRILQVEIRRILVHVFPYAVRFSVGHAPRSATKPYGMQSSDEIITSLVLLWAVIDPIGTVPVFISATQGRQSHERKRIALVAASAAAGILLFFIVVGEILLRAMGVPLPAFQVAGGLILFLFALTMIFGEGKPEGELKAVRSAQDTAIFPLATPSIASPGAMMAVVLLTENDRHSIIEQSITTLLMLLVVGAAYLLMLAAGWISKVIGEGGASIVSRVMGLILASIAATHVLEGIKEYFQ